MDTVIVEPLEVVGISIRTSNTDPDKLLSDMTGLWSRFFAEGIAEKVTNKAISDVYCVYTDYEGDYTKPYTALLGYRVAGDGAIPEGLVRRSFVGGTYMKKVAKGSLNEGVVFNTWNEIWSMESLARSYDADFEIYGAAAQNPTNAEVDILVGLV
jgi:predicted transcriptional regulator YdeE